MPYLWGLASSFFGGTWWWFSLVVAYIFGTAFVADYPKYRHVINSVQSLVVMPIDFPLWLVAAPLLVWAVARLAHREAMRRVRASRLIFSELRISSTPLFTTVMKNGASARQQVAHIYIAKIDVRNTPYSYDSGNDVREAWVKVEFFDLNSKPIKSWEYARWEQNEKPGYQGVPSDRYLPEWNFRRLSANGSANTIDIVTKQYEDSDCFPLRGADQREPEWKSKNDAIPPGEYLVRLQIHGSGMLRPALHCIYLKNPGRGGNLQVAATTKTVKQYWH
jgi:hypothetical protein